MQVMFLVRYIFESQDVFQSHSLFKWPSFLRNCLTFKLSFNFLQTIKRNFQQGPIECYGLPSLPGGDCYSFFQLSQRGSMGSILKVVFKYFPPVGMNGEIGSISLNLFFGRVLGIPFPAPHLNRQTQFGFQLYSFVMLSGITLLYTYYEFLDMFDSYNDLDALTQNISLTFCHVGGVLKGINVLYHIKDIMKIIETLKKSFKEYARTTKQKEVLASSEKFNTIVFLAYVWIVFFTAVAGAFFVALNTNIAGNAFPYRSKLPKNLPLAMRVAYHALSALVIALQVVVLDSLNINFINQIRCQLRVLNYTVDELKREDMPNAESHLRHCIKHHAIIMDLRNRIESIFKYTLLIQFFVSLLIFALTGFQATKSEVSGRMTILYMYSGCIFCELFIYCFFANQVMDQNQALAQIGYQSAWFVFGRRYSKSLGIFLMNAQRPVTFTVGGFFDLSLNTFIGILSKSYSFIVLLRQLYSE